MSFIRMQSGVWGVFVVAIVLAPKTATPEPEVPAYCDRGVLKEVRKQQLDQSERYAFRGRGSSSRCEGAVGRRHSLGEVIFAGAWLSCDAPRPAVVEGWIAFGVPFRPKSQPLRVRVQAMLGNRPYLLDSELDAESQQFKWPLALLEKLSILPSSLAVRVWSGDGAEPVQVPVVWAEADSSRCALPRYFLRFDWVKGQRSADVFLKTPTGEELEPITVSGDYLGPGAWVPISLSHFTSTGIYRIRVGFSPSSASQFLLYHGRNP